MREGGRGREGEGGRGREGERRGEVGRGREGEGGGGRGREVYSRVHIYSFHIHQSLQEKR